MDSAGYSADSLKEAQDMRWLMWVPETLAEAKKSKLLRCSVPRFKKCYLFGL
jgi:hypothetical protein